MTPCAVGFRTHSGWAAAVAVGGPVEDPKVITRSRLKMAERGAGGAVQPYHAAVGLEMREARQLVAAYASAAVRLAEAELRTIIADLRKLGHEVAACGLLLASGRPLPPLESILNSHPLLHTAEGELFREAIRAAGRACGLPVVEVKERELFERGEAELGIPMLEITRRVAGMGHAIGPPWRQDEKYAAAAAWLALVTGVSLRR